METTIGFHNELTQGGYPVAGVIANRVLAFPALGNSSDAMAGRSDTLQRKLLRNYAELHELARRDRRALSQLHAETHAPLLAAVPAVTDAPTSLAGLERFAELLVPLDSLRPQAES